MGQSNRNPNQPRVPGNVGQSGMTIQQLMGRLPSQAQAGMMNPNVMGRQAPMGGMPMGNMGRMAPPAGMAPAMGQGMAPPMPGQMPAWAGPNRTALPPGLVDNMNARAVGMGAMMPNAAPIGAGMTPALPPQAMAGMNPGYAPTTPGMTAPNLPEGANPMAQDRMRQLAAILGQRRV